MHIAGSLSIEGVGCFVCFGESCGMSKAGLYSQLLLSTVINTYGENLLCARHSAKCMCI